MVFPFCTSYLLYLIVCGIQGLMTPFFGTIPNVWLFELFDKSSKSYLQFMHILSTVGQVLGSFMTAPFLSKVAAANGTIPTGPPGNHSVEEPVDHQQTVLSTNLFATAEYSQLWIPFLVICLLRLFMAVVIIGAYFIKASRWLFSFFWFDIQKRPFFAAIPKASQNRG